MAAFVALAALLVFATLAWVLHPLWRARRSSTALAIVVLALGVGVLYRVVGTPAALQPAAAAMPATLPDAIARLEAELRDDPNQVEGLRLLARAYAQQGDAAKARERAAQAARLSPDDADLQVEAAEFRAQADPRRRFDAQAVALLERALAIEPMHQRGRWFLGIARRQQGRAADAAKTWEPLLAVVAPATAAALRPQIDAARAEAGLPPLPVTGSDLETALKVRVTIEPAITQEMKGATVFVIARAPEGPPMPVAVERHPLHALPSEIVLDDSDGPMPTRRLSELNAVDVLVRISRSGDARKQRGDIESPPLRVALPARNAVVIDMVAQ